MRKDILDFLNTPVSSLHRIGDFRAKQFERIKCVYLKDLVTYFPIDFVKKLISPNLSKIRCECYIATVVNIDYFSDKANNLSSNFFHNKTGKRVLCINCSNESGHLQLIYFHTPPQNIKNILKIGSDILVSGKLTINAGKLQVVHPDIVDLPKRIEQISEVESIYSATKNLSSRIISYAVNEALNKMPKFPELIPIDLLRSNNWPSMKEALNLLHNPGRLVIQCDIERAKERLAFDELLVEQARLQICRSNYLKQSKRAQTFNNRRELYSRLKAILPFSLTDSQTEVINEIFESQESDNRMVRLLQGDVGNGKTLVAFCACINAIENCYQAAFVAPTTILAKQHFENLKGFAEELGVRIGLLIGDQSAADKRKSCEMVANGEIQLIIGTHAIFQPNVAFQNLSLIVIDEQHRFGVEQRMSLINKGDKSDILMLSATPIPRTMTLIQYGDMDVSILRHKPSNRKPIITTLLSKGKIEQLLNRISEIISQNQKVYWICPLIEESEKLDLANAVKRYEMLSEIFPTSLVHSRVAQQAQEEIMQDFKDENGRAKILVATTVIEVGVDVQSASVIVIENPERFGLAQLHQLRGRVGRNDLQCYCVLLYGNALSEISLQRLKIIKNCDDGFEIAEQDLMLRGGGRVLSNQQSGLPEFQVLNLEKHGHFIKSAVKLARELVAAERYEEINTLSGLFN